MIHSFMIRSIGKKYLFSLVFIGVILPASLLANSVIVSWQPNTEPDLAGYRVYYGLASRNYSNQIDVGNATELEIGGLLASTTYYFAVKAYDQNGNLSDYSEEVILTVNDIEPPSIVSTTCLQVDQVRVVFNEIVEEISAELISNYRINDGVDVTVQSAELQSDLKTVLLNTTQHANGTYTLTVNNVRDRAAVPNTIASNSQSTYSWNGNDETPPTITKVELLLNDFLKITFSEPIEQTSARTVSNYAISPSVEILYAEFVDGTFQKIFLTTAEHTPGQTYTLTINGIRDAANPPNTIASNSQVTYECIAEDTNPPDLIAIRLESVTELELEFSESLNRSSAETLSHYSISPSLGIYAAILDQEGTVVRLTTAEHSGGDYTISVTGILDEANPPNMIEPSELNYTYTPPDVIPPILQNAELKSNDLLELTFNEALDQTSSQNTNNYRIDPPVNILTATLDFSERVVLLQTDIHVGGDYQIIVNGVKDQAIIPNTIAANSTALYSWSPPDLTPPQLLHIELHGTNMLELVFNESLNRSSCENISNYTITPAVEIIQATLSGDSLNHVYLETADHQLGLTYTLTIQGVMDRAVVPNTIIDGTEMEYSYPIIDNTSPQLISAMLQANIFLELRFSEALDPVSAEDPTHYTISPYIEVKEASLDASLKKVTLKTDNHLAGQQYSITVQGVKDRANPPNVIAAENQVSYFCESQDVIAPSLIRAELYSEKTLVLSFTEPLDPVSATVEENYVIDNGISVIKASMRQSPMEVLLETTSHQKGLYSITVNNVKDLAVVPNTIVPGNWVTYTYTPTDTTPPVLLFSEFINPTLIELNFSESLDPSSAEDIGHYSISNGIIVQRAILDVSMTQVILQTDEHMPGTYTITINGVKDGSGAKNEIDSNTVGQYEYVINDILPPTLVSAILVDENTLHVAFSEALDSESAGEKTHYVINNNIDIEHVYSLPPIGQVFIETGEHAAGEYILTVNEIKDASLNKNPISPYSQIKYYWNPVDTVGPELISANLMADNYIELLFNESVDNVESQKITNYHIDPFVQILGVSLHSSFDKVHLLTAPHQAGIYRITVDNVKDRAFQPNIIGTYNQVEYEYIPPDTTAPGISSVQVRTPMLLAIVFDEEVSRASAEKLSNYSIQPNIHINNAYLLASLQTVHLETDPHQSGVNYTIQIQGIQDRAPISNKMREPVEISYTYIPPDTTKPQLLSAKLQGTTLLELVFSEDIEQISAENPENYRIDPSVEVFTANLEGTKKVFLTTTPHLPGIGYSINVQNVRDRATMPNVILPYTWISYSLPTTSGAADDTPPELAKIEVISSTAIDVVFSEPVDKATAENEDNYAINNNITVNSAILDSNLVRIHLKTSEHQLGQSYHIQVANIYDRASQPNVLSSMDPVKYLLTRGGYVSRLNQTQYDFYLFTPGVSGYYVDRPNYTIKLAPEHLNGAIQVKTANDDKLSTGMNFVSFELKGESTVSVAYDNQIEEIPEWLSTWKPTGEQIIDSRSTVFQIYSREAKTGKIVLGGNYGTMDDNMYLVFVEPHFSNSVMLTNISKSSYQLKYISIGDVCYIDRDYTIASIPDSLKGLLWIQTANDDKNSHVDPFLNFTLSQSSMIYVAYDSRISPLPDWLCDGWTLFDGHIVDSRNTVFDIYCKTYDVGEVSLGGNCGSMDDNMYLILIESTILDSPGDIVPGYFTLQQNYPNPFNPSTKIRYTIQRPGHISLTIYNVLGQQIKVLVDENLSASTAAYEVEWDGTDEMGRPVASGIYLYRIQQETYAKTKRMLLMR
ncbi:Ig-like domain-containing protein [bacterium]|nr:Ig-like domain-containing protein [bacterium]